MELEELPTKSQLFDKQYSLENSVSKRKNPKESVHSPIFKQERLNRTEVNTSYIKKRNPHKLQVREENPLSNVKKNYL